MIVFLFFPTLSPSNHLNMMINFSVFFLFQKKKKKANKKTLVISIWFFFLIFCICLRMIFETTCLRNDVLVRSLTQFVVSLLLSLRFNDDDHDDEEEEDAWTISWRTCICIHTPMSFWSLSKKKKNVWRRVYFEKPWQCITFMSIFLH